MNAVRRGIGRECIVIRKLPMAPRSRELNSLVDCCRSASCVAPFGNENDKCYFLRTNTPRQHGVPLKCGYQVGFNGRRL
jgi:hypothetical protein